MRCPGSLYDTVAGLAASVAPRQQFRKDWNQISICENCTYAFEGRSYDEVFADTVIFSAGA